MCIKKIISTGFLLILISGTVITSGCMDISQGPAGNTEPAAVQNIPEEQLNTESELTFMKDMLSEMKNQGKDISNPLETYRIAKMQAINKDVEGFKASISLFYQQSNTIMLREPGIEDIDTDIKL